MKRLVIAVAAAAGVFVGTAATFAQEEAAPSNFQHIKGLKFMLGTYGAEPA